MRIRALAAVSVASIALAACGSDKASDAATTATKPAATPPTETGTTGGAAVPASETFHGLTVSTDLSNKPTISAPQGAPPKELVVKDVVKGTRGPGKGAVVGDTLVVHYVGISFSDGKQFDASWDTGRPYAFTLGAGNVIPGWVRGLEGMKIGGRRLLIIPPSLGYGATGQPPIKPNETLIFVVDLLNDTPTSG